MNGDVHSDANARINADKHAAKGSHRSPNGLYNSTLGGTAAHAGMNGKLHSSGNKAITPPNNARSQALRRAVGGRAEASTSTRVSLYLLSPSAVL
jgi:hypothetical protein